MTPRLHAECRSEATLIRLLCIASIARTALTRILPLTGCAAWWVTLLCLVPGLLVTALFRLAMALTKPRTLSEALRASLGRFGGWAISLTLGVLLLIDGAATMTALITLFTEGIGTRGTQFTLALMTAAVLLLCLHREGLPRAAYLLRWPLRLAALLVAAFLLADAHIDGLFPHMGNGEKVVVAAISGGVSMAWPLTLLLTVQSIPRPRRITSVLVPCAWAVGLLLLLALTVPHELIARHSSLADALLLPVHFAPSALRTLGQCLLMLVLFLAVGASAQLATVHLCAPAGHSPAWLPYAIAALYTLTQAGNVSRLWEGLALFEPWLLSALAALAVLSALAAIIRRRSA